WDKKSFTDENSSARKPLPRTKATTDSRSFASWSTTNTVVCLSITCLVQPPWCKTRWTALFLAHHCAAPKHPPRRRLPSPFTEGSYGVPRGRGRCGLPQNLCCKLLRTTLASVSVIELGGVGQAHAVTARRT